MKYIRTNEGILKTEKLKLVEDDRFGRRYVNCYNFPFIPLKEADTIEELCDIYVFESKAKESHYMYSRHQYDMGVDVGCKLDNQEFKMHLLEKGDVYGAIWTDKGLIYVAKMNKDGGSELI